MPYIKQDIREDVYFKHFEESRIETPGDLNFIIHDAILSYLIAQDKVGYIELNDVMGVLECVKQEFYRRKVVPYERDKALENGDIKLYDSYNS